MLLVDGPGIVFAPNMVVENDVKNNMLDDFFFNFSIIHTDSATEIGIFLQIGGRRNLYSLSNAAFFFTDLIR